MLNAVWLGLILGAVLWAAFAGNMQAVSASIFDSARSAVDLVIALTGTMVVFLGLMAVARQGGLLRWISHLIAPLMRRLFPDVPADHPAMGAMVMNMACNMMGLGNAAKYLAEIGAYGNHAQALLDLGLLHKAKKRKAKAIACLEEAEPLFVKAGAYVFLKQTRDLLEELR